MNPVNQQNGTSPLIQHLAGLANEIDSVADLGITLSLMPPEKMSGRHRYFENQKTRILQAVQFVSQDLSSESVSSVCDTGNLEQQLQESTACFIAGVSLLENFQALTPELICNAAKSLLCGWTGLHDCISHIAGRYAPVNKDWYAPIQSRHQANKTRLEGLREILLESAST